MKEININLKKAKKIILFNDENNPEKKSIDKKIINNKKPLNNNSNTIDAILNNNNNMNIIENEEKKIIPEKNKNTLIKLNKKIVNKKPTLKTEKIRKEKLFFNTIDKDRYNHQINSYYCIRNQYPQIVIFEGIL